MQDFGIHGEDEHFDLDQELLQKSHVKEMQILLQRGVLFVEERKGVNKCSSR